MLRNDELHAAVLAAPDDDAPRLVYADWLSERGDPRGEFIALEIASAKLARDDERVDELDARLGALWDQHRSEWAPRLHAGTHRGFVEKLSDRRNAPLNLDAADLRDACLRRVSIGHRESLACVDRLLEHTRLRELELDFAVEPQELTELLGRPVFAWLESLNLNNVRRSGHVDAIAAANLADLRSLAVINQWAPDAGVAAGTFAALASWTRAPLRALRLERIEIGAGALAAVLGTPAFAALESLRVPGTGIGEVDVAAICASALPLAELDVSYNALGPASARAIASTPRFAALTSLGLVGAKIGHDGLAALIASRHLSTTCVLSVEPELAGIAAIGYDEAGAIYPTWIPEATGEVASRFRVVVEDGPRGAARRFLGR